MRGRRTVRYKVAAWIGLSVQAIFGGAICTRYTVLKNLQSTRIQNNLITSISRTNKHHKVGGDGEESIQ